MLGAIQASLKTARAHKASDSHLSIALNDRHVSAEWEIGLRDLEEAVGLDWDGDGQITWGELKDRQTEVVAYAFSRLNLETGEERLPPLFEDLLVHRRVDGSYAVLRFSFEPGRSSKPLRLRYDALFDIDPLHRCLVRLKTSDSTRVVVLSPEYREHRVDGSEPDRLHQFASFVVEGVWHIWIGYDHLLFLVVLLLPAVLSRSGPSPFSPVESFSTALLNIVKIVTAFTAAHSITLILAAIGAMELPARLVEPAIAASVVCAAGNNVFPIFRKRESLLAFGFGLLHGFGFAGVLSEIEQPASGLALGLAGFNLGVEAGQLAVVALLFPVLFTLRRWSFYPTLAMKGGSLLIGLLALVWLWERIFAA